MEYKRMGGYNPKMSDEMMMSGQPREMEISVSEAQRGDEDAFAALAPRGDFSRKAMNALVKATNRLLPLFDQSPDYPEFSEDVEVFPTDFVRVLGMFQGAVNAAVDAEMAPESADFMMEEITDDRSLQLLAGRLNQLATDREFKKFLKNPPMEEESEEAPEAVNQMNEMGEAQMDAIMMGRV